MNYLITAQELREAAFRLDQAYAVLHQKLREASTAADVDKLLAKYQDDRREALQAISKAFDISDALRELARIVELKREKNSDVAA